MKKKIVFMLQNGIGFGHFKLALNISKYLKEECEISFITQAKSTRIFDDYDYKVYNFPMLYTLKSNNEILIINNILDDLINEIQPDLVIEDTYPEDFYLNLPSLMNVSKILLLNRLNNSEFENYYFNGILNQYKKIIVLKDKECFINEITSKEVKIFSENSTRMIYLSGVYNEPTKSIKQSVREKYNLNNFEKNIVVNCGAGGWHIGSNVCESIFEEVIKITNNLVEKNVNVQTILVLGPYSDYLQEKFKNIISSNIKIVDFETNLDALFNEVDLCILRPGYNSTMEALSGNENILLLPGISYMEDQDVWCKELKLEYGIDFLNVNNLEKLQEKIEKLILKNTRLSKKPINNTCNVSYEILKTTNELPDGNHIHLAINNLANDYEIDLKKVNKEIDILKKINNTVFLNCALVLNMSEYSPKNIQNSDIFIINNDSNISLNRLSFYDSRYKISYSGALLVEYNEIIFTTIKKFEKELICILNNTQKFSNNIIITFKEINKVDFYSSIDNIMYILKKYNINIDPFTKKIEEMVQEKSNNYKFGYYRPEITKLT